MLWIKYTLSKHTLLITSVLPFRHCFVQDSMVKSSETSFYVEVWAAVESKVKTLQTHTPGHKNAEQHMKYIKTMKQELEKSKEFRNATFNLAHLHDPGAAAIPEDVLEMSKVKNIESFESSQKFTKT